MDWMPDILIVDDNQRMADSIEMLLGARGYTTQAIYDPHKALEPITSGTFGIVLLDLCMPGMSGFEVMDRIGDNRDQIEFIIITGDKDEEAAIQAIRRGAFDFIRKPFEPEELIKRVDNAATQLRLERQRHEAVEALNRAYGELESEVARRTAELMNTNKRLAKEIQDRQLVQISLKESEEKYSALVNNSPDLIYMLDPEGRFSFVGGAVEELLQMSPDDLVGKHFSAIVPQEEDSASQWCFKERRTGDRSTRAHEINLKPAQGAYPISDTKAIFELYASGVYETDPSSGRNEFLGTYGVARDITQRKEAVDAMQESEKRFRELAELLPEILLEINLQGYLVFFNQKALNSTGHTAQRLQEEFKAEQLFIPADRTRFSEACLATARNEPRYNQEFTIQRVDNRQFPVVMRSTPISKGGRVVSIRVLLINITEIKKAREILRRSTEKAETANRTKSEFLANMSHEIRTPLNGIIGVCDLFSRSRLDRKQREYIHIIQSSGKSLLGLINDILDFSKIEAGRLELEEIPFDLRSVVEEVTDLFLERMAKKHIEMVVNVSDDMPERLTGDPLRLRQVLTNLMSNAVKFTETGEIRLIVKSNDAPKGNVGVLFEVMDTGIGIHPTAQSKLFDVFTQADGSTTRKYGGTGLGLTISKRIVEMMGGRIWLESKPSMGTRFFFTACFSEAPEHQSLHRELPSRLKALRILIVEDNPYTLDVLQRMIEGFGCEAEGAPTGERALERCESNAEAPIDLIVMDLDLPGLDGLTVARRMKEAMGEAAPFVIIVSASGREQDMHRLDTSAADGFLVKPVKQSQLLDTMMEIVGIDVVKETTAAETASSPATLSGARVLLVEDNLINRRVAEEILATGGIVVEIAENGREAIDMITGNAYNAVLMDIQMPELDGLEATRMIRAEETHRDLPIIAMTAHAMQGDREKCLDAGMNDYVAKPIDQKELFAVLRRHIAVSDTGAAAPDAAARPESAPGLDIGEGMARLGTGFEAYLDIVEEYCSRFVNFSETILKSIEEEKYEQAVSSANRLKGASGNISAPSLFQNADRLEMACKARKDEDIRTLIHRIEKDLRVLQETAAKLVGDHQNPRR